MKYSQTDVLIVGAGPGGCAAALALQNLGVQHVIVDKATFPRDKICGDAISGKVLDELLKLRPSLVEQMHLDTDHYLPTYGIQFTAPNGKQLDVAFPKRHDEHVPGFVAKRMAFDELLASEVQKHSTLKQGVEILALASTTNGVSVTVRQGDEEETIQARTLIAADGPNSIVRKYLSVPVFKAQHHSVALRAYCKNVSALHKADYLELHFMREVLPGYFWIFPLPNGEANVGMGMLTKKVKQRKLNIREIFKATLDKHPEMQKRFADAQISAIKGWTLPLGSNMMTSEATPNVLFVGDAASLVDPFTGEGIGNAMVSGHLAAQHTVEFLQKGSEHEYKAYYKALRAKLGEELKLSYRLQKLSSKPWLFNFLVNQAVRSPNLQHMLTNMFSDVDLREQLKKPGFYLKLLSKTR